MNSQGRCLVLALKGLETCFEKRLHQFRPRQLLPNEDELVRLLFGPPGESRGLNIEIFVDTLDHELLVAIHDGRVSLEAEIGRLRYHGLLPNEVREPQLQEIESRLSVNFEIGRVDILVMISFAIVHQLFVVVMTVMIVVVAI